jgi:hypothetical protein
MCAALVQQRATNDKPADVRALAEPVPGPTVDAFRARARARRLRDRRPELYARSLSRR